VSEYEQFFHFRSLLNQLGISEDFEDSSYFFQKAKQMQPTGFELILLGIFQFRTILKKPLTTALSIIDNNFESLTQWERTEPNQAFYNRLFLSVRIILIANKSLINWRSGYYDISLSIARDALYLLDEPRYNPNCVFACFGVLMLMLVFVCCHYTPGIDKCFQKTKLSAEVMPFMTPLINNVKDMKQKEEWIHFISFMSRYMNMDELNMPRQLSTPSLTLPPSSMASTPYQNPMNSTPPDSLFNNPLPLKYPENHYGHNSSSAYSQVPLQSPTSLYGGENYSQPPARFSTINQHNQIAIPQNPPANYELVNDNYRIEPQPFPSSQSYDGNYDYSAFNTDYYPAQEEHPVNRTHNITSNQENI
jgi:hypothetical protein